MRTEIASYQLTLIHCPSRVTLLKIRRILFQCFIIKAYQPHCAAIDTDTLFE